MGHTIGIDLGTTFSVVAVINESGHPVIIPNSNHGRLTPSVVAYTKDGGCLVGRDALNQRIINPTGTITAIKRLMGRRFADLTEVDKGVPYEIVEGPQGLAAVKIGNEILTPQEISAELLAELKRYAEEYLGEEVDRAVITVPAYFNHLQRTATMEAGRIAGLEVNETQNEPTCAAIAYGVSRAVSEGLVAVIDLGGGTLDFSILRIKSRAYRPVSTSGDTRLGGGDWTEHLVQYLASEFQREHGVNLLEDASAHQRLWDAAELAKMDLSVKEEVTVVIPFVAQGAKGPLNLNLAVTRTKFEEITADLLARIEAPFKQALADAKVKPQDLDEIILVGGATRMPMVRAKITELVGQEPRPTVNPDEAVAIGVGILAESTTPAEIQSRVTLLDITPLTISVEKADGTADPVIPRNTPVPFATSTLKSTSKDGQRSVTVRIVQGEQPLARDNAMVGSLTLHHITVGQAGRVPIEIKMSLDRNGILTVEAKDQNTGNRVESTFTGTGQLPAAEIERLSRKVAAGADKSAAIEDATTTEPEPAPAPA